MDGGPGLPARLPVVVGGCLLNSSSGGEHPGEVAQTQGSTENQRMLVDPTQRRPPILTRPSSLNYAFLIDILYRAG